VWLLEGHGIWHRASDTLSSIKKFGGLAQSSQELLCWPLVSQFLSNVIYATNLIVTFNTCSGFANSKSASFNAHNLFCVKSLYLIC
jgi:hypothetical protein